MSPKQAKQRRGGTDDEATGARTVHVHSEDLHIRSYAHREAYDLRLEVATLDGDTVFQDSYYLQPGATESELDAVPAGEYEIRATLDRQRTETLRCRLGPEPDRTVLIEVGNGILSLTEGLRAR
ncbi:hypothetical protein [Halobellus marinus]|uniref:hypothetical protein n=1 Tax=Halobellus TaxID=1073986 RepID=UPI0028A637A5|nr:hypothetical protein [Halobellus sp. DFY28]